MVFSLGNMCESKVNLTIPSRIFMLNFLKSLFSYNCIWTKKVFINSCIIFKTGNSEYKRLLLDIFGSFSKLVLLWSSKDGKVGLFTSVCVLPFLVDKYLMDDCSPGFSYAVVWNLVDWMENISCCKWFFMLQRLPSF